MRAPSLRTLASVAARRGMRMRRFDFVAAYLQGELEAGETVYCLPPPGYENERIGSDGRPMIAKVVKPIYGMSQAGRRWQRTLFPWMKDNGFTQTDGDSCVFRKVRKDEKGAITDELIVGCYVDDLCVCHGSTSDGSLYAEFVQALESRFQVEDEGELSDLLGIEFEFKDGHVKLHQKQYIERLVKTYLPDGVPAKVQKGSTPCDVNLPLHVANALSSTDVPDASLLKLSLIHI